MEVVNKIMTVTRSNENDKKDRTLMEVFTEFN